MKQSRRAQRMERHNARAWRQPPFNLVALMDIFTILVFFLLVNSSDIQDISVPRSVDLPDSIADIDPNDTPTVMVTREDIQLEGAVVAQMEPLLLEEGGLIIQALRDAIVSGAESEDASKDRGEITILSDRTIPYRVLKKVIATCTDAGFGRVSLAVMQAPAQEG